MFDGASPRTLEGSTAEIALWLDAPVLLVVDAHGAARSLAATVEGFCQFEPTVRVAGVIANRGGSERHRTWLADSLDAAATARLMGMIPKGALPSLPSRHLGLVAADQAHLSAGVLDCLADACERHLDIKAIMGIAKCKMQKAKCKLTNPQSPISNRPVRLGIARDEAFHFYYPDNLEAIAQAGAEWCRFRRFPMHGCRPIWTVCISAAATLKSMSPGWPPTRPCWPTFAGLPRPGGRSTPSAAG